MAEQIVRVVFVLQILQFLDVGAEDIIRLDIDSYDSISSLLYLILILSFSDLQVLTNTSTLGPVRHRLRCLFQQVTREDANLVVELRIEPTKHQH